MKKMIRLFRRFSPRNDVIAIPRSGEAISKQGFTLIEILMAITILALIGTIAIPNLRQFSDDQVLINGTQDLKNAFRQAQSNGVSNIKCGTKSSTQWTLTLNPQELTSQSKTGYKIYATCQNPGDLTSTLETKSTVEFVPGLTVKSTGCANSKINNIDIIFKGTITSVDCKDGNPAPAFPFLITLENSSKSQATRTLIVNKIGIIAE